ncbi:50S ribosomal protein L11 methyltransferase [Salisaeta longa]|uniref:50S ribosomal protein L11 methyltransferase n=1 Tax=Salisaeta longa TaxID=503170 RepID=UPI0003B4E4B9|nr:50S ribosomal protein L11 methyltransferase [Salisaeta longa]
MPDTPPTIHLTLNLPAVVHDAAVGQLESVALGFQSMGDELHAYIPAPRWNEALRRGLRTWLRAHGATATWQETEVPPQNWNATWEATHAPRTVGPFLIAPHGADVHPTDAQTLVRIDPKMSFGTGAHATTQLVLQLMAPLDLTDARVLDAGTGTGVLGIAAALRGARTVQAFDTDAWAIANARENVAANRVADRVHLYQGAIGDVPAHPADVVCANITRDVLLALLPAFSARTAPGAVMLLAGVLTADRPRMLAAAADTGWELAEEATRDGWWGAHFHRTAA